MNAARRAGEGHCGPSMIAFGGALLIATSLAPGLAADVAWSWLSAGAAGLSSAVAISERHRQGAVAAGPSQAPPGPGEPLFVLSVLREERWIETSAVYTTIEQAGHAAGAIRQRLGCETAISVLDPRFAVSAVNPRALSGAGSPAASG
jgi:hypothetical protein